MLPLKCKVKQFVIGPAQSLKKDLHASVILGALICSCIAAVWICIIFFYFFCGALNGLYCFAAWVIPFSAPIFLFGSKLLLSSVGYCIIISLPPCVCCGCCCSRIQRQQSTKEGSFLRGQWRQQRLLSTVAMAATKAPFYSGDGGSKGLFLQRQQSAKEGSFLQRRWWQQRLLSTVAMAATKASFNGGNGGNKGFFQRR
jgi:predicted Rdx family selenoprotein